MTTEEALQLLRRLGRERAFGRHVGSDRLIQAGLEALLAGVESPSIPRLAGLGRREEPEAAELFDAALEELGLFFRPPTDPVEAKWAMAYWIAEQISDGEYETHELPMSPDVLSIAVARAPVASKLDLLVGAIRRDGSNHWFSVIGLGGCENWVLIGDVKIDFEITTPPAPAWGSVRHVPLTDHVVMIARDVEETNAVEFLHYDGYALRVGRVQHGDAEWNIEHTVVGMHTDRKDLSLLE